MTLLSCPVALFFLVLNCVSVTERSGYYGVGGGGGGGNRWHFWAVLWPFFSLFLFCFFPGGKTRFLGQKKPKPCSAESTRIEHCEKETKVGRFRFIFSCMLSHRMIFLRMCVNWLCFECDLVFPFLVSSHWTFLGCIWTIFGPASPDN